MSQLNFPAVFPLTFDLENLFVYTQSGDRLWKLFWGLAKFKFSSLQKILYHQVSTSSVCGECHMTSKRCSFLFTFITLHCCNCHFALYKYHNNNYDLSHTRDSPPLIGVDSSLDSAYLLSVLRKNYLLHFRKHFVLLKVSYIFMSYRNHDFFFRHESIISFVIYLI